MTEIPTQTQASGRVQQADGPVVTVQFPRNAVPPLFSLLVGVEKESLCVVQQMTAGRVRAVAIRMEALWTPGQEIVDTGQPFTGNIDMPTVWRAVESLRPRTEGARPIESGIKTIDVFAPMTLGGATGLFAEWGLGVLVLLPELLHRLEHADLHQTFFTFVPAIRDEAHWREVLSEITVGRRNLSVFYLPTADPISPKFIDGMKGLNTTLTLSRRLAEQSIWPCLDPLRCRSLRREGMETDSPRKTLVTEIGGLLRDYYTLQFAPGEVSQRSLSPHEQRQVQRARKLLRFLSQPFFLAEPYTGRPGVSAPPAAALKSFSDIVAGRYDDLSPEAFTMTGAEPIH